MMKKRLVWATLLALVSTSVPAPTWADDEEDDADVPPFARGLVEKNDYRAMRDDYLNLVRGVPHFLPYEPRSRAIRDLERAEREIPSIDPSFWTEIGPAPIPNGQVGTGAQLPVSGRTISIAIHPSNPLARATFAMLEGLCELNGASPADYAPTTPADFFNLVGMAEWRDLDEKLAAKEATSWA